jgi:hypothetical protein
MLRDMSDRARRLTLLIGAVVGVVLMAAPLGLARGSGAGKPTALPAHPTWYWQLTGRIENSHQVAIYDIDGFDSSATEVARLHRLGRFVVCYIDVGTWEQFRPDARRFPRSVLGRSNGWPGERWLDIRRLEVLEPIMRARFEMCAQKRFDAVEPDNIDAYANRSGFPITAREQLRYDEWVARTVHGLGLAVLQKNDAGQARALEPHFDGVLDEQCNQYHECGAFKPYLTADKPVLDAEYKPSLYPGFCANDARLGISGVLYGVSLDGRPYRPCP